MSSRALHIASIVVLAVTMSLLAGCSLSKGLSDGQRIYLGTSIYIVDESKAASVADFNVNIRKIPRPSTTTGLFNIYTGIHNIYGPQTKKGFKRWVSHKLGKQPVLYDGQYPANTEARLRYYLNGKGYFNSSITCLEGGDGPAVRIDCTVQLDDRYTVDSIIFPVDSTYASLQLDATMQRAILQEGSYYDRDRLEYERLRLATLAQDMGFADFGSENVLFYVDTALQTKKVDIYTKIVQPTDSTVHMRYVLDSIRIFPNHTIRSRASAGRHTVVSIKPGLTVHETEHYLNHQLISRLLLEEPGQYYSGSDERRTINRLLDLGLFRFINVENHATGSGREGRIVQDILLTPDLIQSISGEVELNNRSGNFFGTGSSVQYSHKNLFGHAERLDVRLAGQVETQLDESSTFINSSDLTASAELAFPRVIVPFVSIKEGRNYIPRSLVRASYTTQRRSQYYSLRSLTARAGYRWKETARKLHELYPIVINEVGVGNKTAAFELLLAADPRLTASFENTLISGLQYYYTFSDQAGKADRTHTYLRGELETSGNLVGLLAPQGADGVGRVLGRRYAQFTKATLDYRRYWPAGRGNIAARAIAGVGLSYGNSSELPYIKQYLIGGSNSLRAFPLRGLGPGNFVAPTNVNFNNQFVDQTGDMKLELNVEYRFPIFNYLKGAAFVDAGNVWLINNEDQLEGNFVLGDFYEQIAIGTGLGIRLDFDFFLIRLDVAFALRSPSQQGFEWVYDEVRLGSATWRRDQLRYNLGIGYPF